ncbi:MAG: MFS transporter [Holophaga sp.]|jgi:MFS family permease
MAALPESLRSLRHRNYRLFCSGQLVSLIGTWMQMVALSWLVYRLTGQAAMLGLMSFCNLIPVFLLAPVGGLVADRIPSRPLLLTTQTVAMVLALTLALLTLTGQVRLWHLFVLALALGTANAFDNPARQVFAARTVPREDLMNAVALNSSMVTGARIAGPALAGVLVAALGEGWCFFLNGISYLAVLGGLLAMRFPPGQGTAPADSQSHLRRLLDGFAMVRRTMPIRSLLVLLGLLSLLGAPYAVLLPIFAKEVFHGSSRTFGLLSATSGAGALMGALTLAARPHFHGLGRWIAATSLLFGLALAGFAGSHWLPLSLPLMLLAGYAYMVEMAATNTMIQMMVPNAFRGRVMSIYTMMFLGMAPLGGLLAGLLAHRLGAPLTVALGGLGCVVCGTAFTLHYRRWREGARDLVRTAEREARGRQGIMKAEA